jgi:hypothetical protein
MENASCEINGREYRISYMAIPVEGGIEYSGTLFLQTPLHFKYIAYDNATIGAFFPDETEEDICDAIRNVILRYESN